MRKMSKGWYVKRWIPTDCEEIDLGQFKFEILDALSLTPKDLERILAKAQDPDATDMDGLASVIAEVVRHHNFTHPETDEELAQFQEDPQAALELPLLVIRYIMEKFMEAASPDKSVIPLRKRSSS